MVDQTKNTANALLTKAFLKARVSKELKEDFLKFLDDYPDYLSQVIYLLDSKKYTIEQVILDLFDVPIKEQPTWARAQEKIEAHDQPTDFAENSSYQDINPKLLFKEWKQDHGFDSNPLEIGDVHTFVRFEKILDGQKETKFKWMFCRARYGKGGWGNERLLQSVLKSLLDNNSNPGWVVRSFLEENKNLADAEGNIRTGDELPNPFVLNAHDSHELFNLLIGNAYLYYQDSNQPIVNSFKTLSFRLYHFQGEDNHYLVGYYTENKKPNAKEPLLLLAEELLNDMVFFLAPSSGVIHKNKYFPLQSLSVSSKMQRDSLFGVFVPKEEWDDFAASWQKYFPDVALQEKPPIANYCPSFLTRNLKYWQNWLHVPEKFLLAENKHLNQPTIVLASESKTYQSNRISFWVENFDVDSLQQNPELFEKAPLYTKMFSMIKNARKVAHEDDPKLFQISFERHEASQFLALLENYPYAYNNEKQPLFRQAPLCFQVTVNKNLENARQYVLQGNIIVKPEPYLDASFEDKEGQCDCGGEPLFETNSLENPAPLQENCAGGPLETFAAFSAEMEEKALSLPISGEPSHKVAIPVLQASAEGETAKTTTSYRAPEALYSFNGRIDRNGGPSPAFADPGFVGAGFAHPGLTQPNFAPPNLASPKFLPPNFIGEAGGSLGLSGPLEHRAEPGLLENGVLAKGRLENGPMGNQLLGNGLAIHPTNFTNPDFAYPATAGQSILDPSSLTHAVPNPSTNLNQTFTGMTEPGFAGAETRVPEVREARTSPPPKPAKKKKKGEDAQLDQLRPADLEPDLAEGEVENGKGAFLPNLNSATSYWELQTKDFQKSRAIGLIPAFLIYENHVLRIGRMQSTRLINDSLVGVIVEEQEISDFYSVALPFLKQREVSLCDPQGLLRVSALYNYKIKGHMKVWEVRGVLMGRLSFHMYTDIGVFDYPLDTNYEEFTKKLDDRIYKIPRNKPQETALMEMLYSHGWIDEGDYEYSMNEQSANRFVLEVLPLQNDQSSILYLGHRKLKKWRVRVIEPSFSTAISTGIDWFDVNLKIEFEGNEIALNKIIDLWRSGQSSLKISDEEGLVAIDQKWIEKFAPLLNCLVESNQRNQPKAEREIEQEMLELEQNLRVDKFQIGILHDLTEASFDVRTDKKWKDMVQTLKHHDKIPRIDLQGLVQAQLRDYQKEGVYWLLHLRKMGFCGILADDMGLGKTLQTLTFITLDRKNDPTKPVLIVVPTTVIFNWQEEICKFTPHLKALIFHGPKRKEVEANFSNYDIVVTSYNLLQKDLEIFKSYTYSLIILDEAQMIKNARSKNAQAVSELSSEARFSLTGTPVENSVFELWSQFHFLMPGLLGNIKEFQKQVLGSTVNRLNDKKDYSFIRRQTKPFILRRMKQNVATELPQKIEQTLYCEMFHDQRKLYESLLEVIRMDLKQKIKNKTLQQSRIAIFDAMLKLRQICCDPRLNKFAGEKPPDCAKFNMFLETLEGIVENGHRVLVFSQFVKMLELMHQPLREKNIAFLQLDGGVQCRQEVVSKFQNNADFPVFLISLKAGGVGINLTQADYVIHYDPWWNPAVEMQATDRAYRIGQKNHVHVYKLITSNSIEEKIQDLQKKKQFLADRLVQDSKSLEDLFEVEDFEEIFDL